MPWKTNVLESPKCIEIVYLGNVTPEELYMALKNSVLLSRENNTILFLSDCTDMTGGHSVIDLYGLIGMFEKLNITTDAKEAIIMKSLQSSADEIKFYETACKNRGFNVKIFTGREDAVVWLAAQN
ncbi:MAG: hypothetical protein P4L45_13955 [Ignavibacteriaceae bacterium]|nr:hypothetical protein [Ignavibacteriaceae bacterium]